MRGHIGSWWLRRDPLARMASYLSVRLRYCLGPPIPVFAHPLRLCRCDWLWSGSKPMVNQRLAWTVGAPMGHISSWAIEPRDTFRVISMAWRAKRFWPHILTTENMHRSRGNHGRDTMTPKIEKVMEAKQLVAGKS